MALQEKGATLNQDQNHGLNLMMIKEDSPIMVIMVPFPAQGHLNLLLQLSRVIITSSSNTIPLHFVGSTIHNRQTKTRANGLMSPLDMSQIQFHDFDIPKFESPPPNLNSHNKFPSHLQPSFEAAMHLREPFAALLRTLSQKAKRIVIIHDILISYVVQDAASIPNAETYIFQSTSAFTYFTSTYESMEPKPFTVEPKTLVPDGLAAAEDCVSPEHLKLIQDQIQFMEISSGDILYTNRVIEGVYLDMLLKLPHIGGKGRKLWGLGPFNPVNVTHYSSNQRNSRSLTDRSCLEWLDKQAPKSVLYVSFGTTGTMPDQEIRELAIGLEQSEVKFLWVLRDVDKGDVFTGEVERGGLPLGFEERMERMGMGMVVRDWAPQLEILGHPATGGFLCHGGWNSTLESISLGVPIAAWPMHSDHPRNAALIAQVLKIGVIVNEWDNRHEMVTSSMVREAVRKLMASKEGDEMRKRAEELGVGVQQSTAEGGVSTMELNSFIAHITR